MLPVPLTPSPGPPRKKTKKADPPDSPKRTRTTKTISQRLPVETEVSFPTPSFVSPSSTDSPLPVSLTSDSSVLEATSECARTSSNQNQRLPDHVPLSEETPSSLSLKIQKKHPKRARTSNSKQRLPSDSASNSSQPISPAPLSTTSPSPASTPLPSLPPPKKDRLPPFVSLDPRSNSCHTRRDHSFAVDMLNALCASPDGCFSALPVDRFCSVLCWAFTTEGLWERFSPPSEEEIDLELSEEQECPVCMEVWRASKTAHYANKAGVGPWKWEVDPLWWVE